MFQLRIEDKILESLEDFQSDVEFKHSWAKETINFCRDWLAGKESFELSTSGSTGKPKKISVDRSQMEASAKATQSFLATTHMTRILNCLSPEYIAGKMNLVRAMVWNCSILCEEPSNRPFGEQALAFQPTFTTMVPSQVAHIMDIPGWSIGLRHLLIGGAPLPESLKAKIVEKKIPAWQTYAMTETVSHIAMAKITSFPLRYHTLPRVTIGMTQRGTLWTQSPMSRNERLETNDIIQLISPTEFYWKGRLDFVINSGGIKLHPEELERKIEIILHALGLSYRFFLFAIPDETLGEKLGMVIEAEDRSQESMILGAMKSQLGSIYSPKEVFTVNNFDETANGKLDRKSTLSQLGF